MNEKAFSYAKDLRPAFLAHMADRLNALVCRQTKVLLQKAGAQTPVRSVSVMIYLDKNGPSSVADIARSEGQSHQLVTSRTAPLERLGLIKSYDDPQDDRRRLLKLTAKGAKDAARVTRASKDVAASLGKLNDEIGVDLMSVIEAAEQSLLRQPIAERVNSRAA